MLASTVGFATALATCFHKSMSLVHAQSARSRQAHLANDNFGRFRTTYPMCDHLKCKEPPDSSLVAMFAVYEPTTSTDGRKSSFLTEDSPWRTEARAGVDAHPVAGVGRSSLRPGTISLPQVRQAESHQRPVSLREVAIYEGPDGPVMGARSPWLVSRMRGHGTTASVTP